MNSETTHNGTVGTINFSHALTAVKTGKFITRAGWNGKGQYVGFQSPDKNSKMTLPYLFMKTVEGNFVPWLASQTDILATDWIIE